MNYSKKIFKMLGVKPNEEFFLDALLGKYRIDENLKIYVSKGGSWFVSAVTIGEILADEYKIIKNITKKEKLAIDYARNCGMNWLCKDENGNIYAYEQKPEKFNGEWVADFGSCVKIHIPISFISWKDEEPYYIGDVDDEF